MGPDTAQGLAWPVWELGRQPREKQRLQPRAGHKMGRSRCSFSGIFFFSENGGGGGLVTKWRPTL